MNTNSKSASYAAAGVDVTAGYEAVSRIKPLVASTVVPGVLGGGPAATASESFGPEGTLEAPQYTHPPEFRGMKVPEVLLSGDHAKIEAWKRYEARKLTEAARPELLK